MKNTGRDNVAETNTKKIIHVDMDCFYAAIEIRDDPSLANKPVAVGGDSDRRGVLCTCNYIARKFGVRSAMSTAHAYRLCRDLIVLPINMTKYKEAAKLIHNIFYQFTDLVEPLSLDEAFLDVTGSPHFQGSATLIAKEIRQRIFAEINITASAGVAPNKFLAKIASGWKKPNGLFVIRPGDIDNFVKDLPVTELFGVGKVTAKKLHDLNLKVCADLHKLSLFDLTNRFGKMGQQLYNQSRGLDNREVIPNRIRKSVSVEETFSKDISRKEECIEVLHELHGRLLQRLNDDEDKKIKNQFVKIKFSNFKQKTIERVSTQTDLHQYILLLETILEENNIPIRLIGIGVHFQQGTLEPLVGETMQQTLF